MTSSLERDRAIASSLVRGYLHHAGLNGGHPGDDDPAKAPDPLTADLLRALLSLTDDYSSRYAQQLRELASSWAIDQMRPRSSFTEVLDTVFADGCNWGRVVTIFIFVGMFLRKCRDQRVASEEVADWTVDYLVDRIAPWVRDNGGWTGLLRFYTDGDAVARMQEDSRMLTLLTLAGAAGLLVLGLTTLLANHA